MILSTTIILYGFGVICWAFVAVVMQWLGKTNLGDPELSTVIHNRLMLWWIPIMVLAVISGVSSFWINLPSVLGLFNVADRVILGVAIIKMARAAMHIFPSMEKYLKLFTTVEDWLILITVMYGFSFAQYAPANAPRVGEYLDKALSAVSFGNEVTVPQAFLYAQPNAGSKIALPNGGGFQALGKGESVRKISAVGNYTLVEWRGRRFYLLTTAIN